MRILAALAAAALALLAALALQNAGLLSGGGAARATPAAAPPLRVPSGTEVSLSSLPPALAAAASRAIGAADPAYGTVRSHGRLLARNAPGRLSITYAGNSVELAGPRGARLSVGLAAVSFGGRTVSAPSVARRVVSGNVVTYARGGVSEWYANGPLGLEQGFTIARPSPSAERAGGSIQLELALPEGTRAEPAGAGSAVRLLTAHGAFHYSRAFAFDADGRSLPVRLLVSHGELALALAAAGARYPITVDPIITGEEGAVGLESPEIPAGAGFGVSVAVSGEGNTAIVGAVPAAGGSSGTAWVFGRTGSSWTIEGPPLTPPQEAVEEEPSCTTDPEGSTGACGFGQSVAIDASGTLALVGDTPVHSKVGAAYVYVSQGEQWLRIAALKATAPEGGEHFGASVALAGNGEVALVGAPGTSPGRGAAWLFTPAHQSWSGTHGVKLQSPKIESGAHFGASVALSEDGTTALIGAPGPGPGKTIRGDAFVYRLEGGEWKEWPEPLTGRTEEQEEGDFGSSVALSADASTALVGARNDNGGQGAAYTFIYSGSAWQPFGERKLTGPGEAGEHFGTSVALSANGTAALVGAPHTEKKAGGASFYTRTSEGWTSEQNVTGRETESGRGTFGAAVSLSGDGETLLVGAPAENTKKGAAWLFGPRPEVTQISPTHGPEHGGKEVTITGVNLAGATAVFFGSTASPAIKAGTVGEHEQVVAVAPAGVGKVDITVETPGWRSETNTADEFEYQPESSSGSGGGKGGESGSPKGTHPGHESNDGLVLLNDILYGGRQTTGSSGGSSGSSPAYKSSVSPSCMPRLRSTHLPVGSRGRANVSLTATSGRCSGRLSLTVRTGSGHIARTETLASGSFAVQAGHVANVALPLSRAARALLKQRHGRIQVTLVLLRTTPSPRRSVTARVTLALAAHH